MYLFGVQGDTKNHKTIDKKGFIKYICGRKLYAKPKQNKKIL